MKELEFINTIKSILKNNYIGDDCAYLEDLGIVITQDSLIENIHFKTEYTTPYQLGYKSIMVNLSDIAASGATPAYLTVALSLPGSTDKNFIEQFYLGAKSAATPAQIVGGDITASDKIAVSVCAIGKIGKNKISSRSHACSSQLVVTTGEYGSSAVGLDILLNKKNTDKNLINAHLMPTAKLEFALSISQNIKSNYAMMDTSDGLCDALVKIAQSSNKKLVIDFNKIKYNKSIESICSDYKNKILYGGEDYNIVATVPSEMLKYIKDGYIIGKVEDAADEPSAVIDFGDSVLELKNTDNCYNHFAT